MEDLLIEQHDKTPEVRLLYKSGEIIIEGISVPENSAEFFIPIIKWVKNYVEQPQEKTKVSLNLYYTNTSTLHFIYTILEILQNELPNDTIEILWYYSKDDDDGFELGEDFRDAMNEKIIFKFIGID